MSKNTHKKNSLTYLIELLKTNQQEFAKKLNYSKNPINKAISQNGKVSKEVMQSIEETFHIPPDLLFDENRRCRPLTEQLKHDIEEALIKKHYSFLDNYTIKELNLKERELYLFQQEELRKELATLEVSENNSEYIALKDNIKAYTNSYLNEESNNGNLMNIIDVQEKYSDALSYISRYVTILNTQQLPSYVLEEVLSSLEILTGIKSPEKEQGEQEQLRHKIITNVKNYEKEKSQEVNELLKPGIISEEDL